MTTAHEVLSEIGAYNTHKGSPEPARTALVVIDMQRFFDDIAAPIVPTVNQLIEVARAGGRPVLFTRHGHHNLATDGGVLADWWADDLAMVGTPPWELTDALDVRDDDPVLDKTRYSALTAPGSRPGCAVPGCATWCCAV